MTAGTGQPGVVDRFAEVARSMAGAGDAAEARQLLVTRARSSLGSAGAALWHRTPQSRMVVDSFTDPDFIAVMTDIVGAHPDGPAWQAIQDRTITVVEDFEAEPRWPGYTRRLVAETPVRSAVVYPLGIGGHDLGVLAVYSHQRRHFDPTVITLGTVFAACASLALENADLVAKSRNLERALASSRRIGIAIGIVMTRHHVTEMQAFDLLRVTSNNNNTKLTDVAEDVIHTGTVRRLSGTATHTLPVGLSRSDRTGR